MSSRQHKQKKTFVEDPDSAVFLFGFNVKTRRDWGEYREQCYQDIKRYGVYIVKFDIGYRSESAYLHLRSKDQAMKLRSINNYTDKQTGEPLSRLKLANTNIVVYPYMNRRNQNRAVVFPPLTKSRTTAVSERRSPSPTQKIEDWASESEFVDEEPELKRQETLTAAVAELMQQNTLVDHSPELATQITLTEEQPQPRVHLTTNRTEIDSARSSPGPQDQASGGNGLILPNAIEEMDSSFFGGYGIIESEDQMSSFSRSRAPSERSQADSVLPSEVADLDMDVAFQKEMNAIMPEFFWTLPNKDATYANLRAIYNGSRRDFLVNATHLIESYIEEQQRIYNTIAAYNEIVSQYPDQYPDHSTITTVPTVNLVQNNFYTSTPLIRQESS